MSNRVFFTSDTHFGHAKIIEFARPQFANLDEMHEYIISQWNSVVRPDDTVWHLGDVCLGGSHNLRFVEQLNGRINLVKGNHCTYDKHEYDRYFNKVLGVAEYKGAVLTHMPVHQHDLELQAGKDRPRYHTNIHGHLHDERITKYDWLYFDSEHRTWSVEPVIDARYQCVSGEQFDFRPVTFDEIMARREKELYAWPSGGSGD